MQYLVLHLVFRVAILNLNVYSFSKNYIHRTRDWKMHAQTPALEWTFSNPHPQIYWMECWSIISFERPKICKSNGIQKLLCLINRNLLTFTCLTLFDLILESSISFEHLIMLDVFLICLWTLITMRKLFAVVLLFINPNHTAPPLNPSVFLSFFRMPIIKISLNFPFVFICSKCSAMFVNSFQFN